MILWYHSFLNCSFCIIVICMGERIMWQSLTCDEVAGTNTCAPYVGAIYPLLHVYHPFHDCAVISVRLELGLPHNQAMCRSHPFDQEGGGIWLLQHC